MRCLVRHGHFSFFPKVASDVARFNSYFGADLVRDPEHDFYTFKELAGLADYCLEGKVYKDLPATKTYEGKPWEILRENGWVFSLALKTLVLKETIAIPVNPALVNYYFVTDSPLLQPGSVNAAGSRILSYDGEFDHTANCLFVREFSYE